MYWYNSEIMKQACWIQNIEASASKAKIPVITCRALDVLNIYWGHAIKDSFI